MTLNQTPRAERPHIAIFGRRNSGKSSLINAITNQTIAIVSDIKGTTTDPVYKSMEILPLGPVVIIDTAGLDDSGALGEMRIKKTMEVLDKTDIAVVVIDASEGLTPYDTFIIESVMKKNLTPLVVYNKADLIMPDFEDINQIESKYQLPVISVSSKTGQGIDDLKERLARHRRFSDDSKTLVGDLICAGDLVVLVTPIDSAAPKGRLILPQQQVLRDILDCGGMAIVCKETELAASLTHLSEPPKLVITDSQVFDYVNKIVPTHIPLTGFSILYARYKGDLEILIRGVKAIRSLSDGARILVAEGCTHHRQTDDIGTQKIPRWLKNLTGKQLTFDYSSGTTFTEDVKQYDLIVHCGACMLNAKAMQSRLEQAKSYGVPIVNYGVMIAYVHDMLDRALKPFTQAYQLWSNLD